MFDGVPTINGMSLYPYPNNIGMVEEESIASEKEKLKILLEKIETTPDSPDFVSKLAKDLSDKKPSRIRNMILKNAIKGKYGELTSDWFDPKMTLCEHLHEAGCDDLANKAKEGKYNG